MQLASGILNGCFPLLCARYLIMTADLNCDVARQAVTTENEVIVDYDNFSDIFFQSLQTNLNSCETYDLISNETFSVNIFFTFNYSR